MIFSNQAFLWFISTLHIILAAQYPSESDEKGARHFLDVLNDKSIEIADKLVTAQWNFETNNIDTFKDDFVSFECPGCGSPKLSNLGPPNYSAVTVSG